MIFVFESSPWLLGLVAIKNTWIPPNMTIESSPISLWILHLLLLDLEILIPALLDFCTQSVIYYMSHKPSVTEDFSLSLKSDRLIHSNWHRDQHIFHPYSINLRFNCFNISKAILSPQNVSVLLKLWTATTSEFRNSYSAVYCQTLKTKFLADSKVLNRNNHCVVPQSLGHNSIVSQNVYLFQWVS